MIRLRLSCPPGGRGSTLPLASVCVDESSTRRTGPACITLVKPPPESDQFHAYLASCSVERVRHQGQHLAQGRSDLPSARDAGLRADADQRSIRRAYVLLRGRGEGRGLAGASWLSSRSACGATPIIKRIASTTGLGFAVETSVSASTIPQGHDAVSVAPTQRRGNVHAHHHCRRHPCGLRQFGPSPVLRLRIEQPKQ